MGSISFTYGFSIYSSLPGLLIFPPYSLHRFHLWLINVKPYGFRKIEYPISNDHITNAFNLVTFGFSTYSILSGLLIFPLILSTGFTCGYSMLCPAGFSK
jgi:hypothetical protein